MSFVKYDKDKGEDIVSQLNDSTSSLSSVASQLTSFASSKKVKVDYNGKIFKIKNKLTGTVWAGDYAYDQYWDWVVDGLYEVIYDDRSKARRFNKALDGINEVVGKITNTVAEITNVSTAINKVNAAISEYEATDVTLAEAFENQEDIVVETNADSGVDVVYFLTPTGEKITISEMVNSFYTYTGMSMNAEIQGKLLADAMGKDFDASAQSQILDGVNSFVSKANANGAFGVASKMDIEWALKVNGVEADGVNSVLNKVKNSDAAYKDKLSNQLNTLVASDALVGSTLLAAYTLTDSLKGFDASSEVEGTSSGSSTSGGGSSSGGTDGGSSGSGIYEQYEDPSGDYYTGSSDSGGGSGDVGTAAGTAGLAAASTTEDDEDDDEKKVDTEENKTEEEKDEEKKEEGEEKVQVEPDELDDLEKEIDDSAQKTDSDDTSESVEDENGKVVSEDVQGVESQIDELKQQISDLSQVVDNLGQKQTDYRFDENGTIVGVGSNVELNTPEIPSDLEVINLVEEKDYDDLARQQFELMSDEEIDARSAEIRTKSDEMFDSEDKTSLVSELQNYGYSNSDIDEIIEDRDLTFEALLDGDRREELSNIANDLATSDGIKNYQSTYDIDRTVDDIRNGETAANVIMYRNDQNVIKARNEYETVKVEYKNAVQESNDAVKQTVNYKQQVDSYKRSVESVSGTDINNWTDQQINQYNTLVTQYNESINVSRDKMKNVYDYKERFEEAESKYAKSKEDCASKVKKESRDYYKQNVSEEYVKTEPTEIVPVEKVEEPLFVDGADDDDLLNFI